MFFGGSNSLNLQYFIWTMPNIQSGNSLSPAETSEGEEPVGAGFVSTARLEIFFDALWGIFATIAGVQLAFLEVEDVCAVHAEARWCLKALDPADRPAHTMGANCTSVPPVVRKVKTFDNLLNEKAADALHYFFVFLKIVVLLWHMHNIIFYDQRKAKFHVTMTCHGYLAIFSALIPVLSNFSVGSGMVYQLGLLGISLFLLLVQSLAMHGLQGKIPRIVGLPWISVVCTFIACMLIPEDFQSWVGNFMWMGLWLCLLMVERMVSGHSRAFQGDWFHYKKERVEAFTDGVFAIAATFIALELKAENETNASKWLSEHSDKIVCMMVTMFMLLTLWSIHHKIFARLPEKLSRGVVFWNSIFCFSITLVPISTSFAYYFEEYKVALSLPSFICLFASSLLVCLDLKGFRGKPRTLYTKLQGWAVVPAVSCTVLIVVYASEHPVFVTFVLVFFCGLYVCQGCLYYGKPWIDRCDKRGNQASFQLYSRQDEEAPQRASAAKKRSRNSFATISSTTLQADT